MDYSQFRKISHKERIKLFLSSYSGFAAIVGLLCFIHCFLYHSLWINIEAPFQFMVSLGIVFDAVSLSIIASTVFYFITIYFPKQHKRKIEEQYIRRWLQQLEITPIDTWFEYFDNLFHWESIYMEQIVKYGDSVPSEILVEFEKYKQFDNLKIAVYTYNRYYEKNILYRTIGGFSHLAWTHAHSLMSLPELYIKHLYD